MELIIVVVILGYTVYSLAELFAEPITAYLNAKTEELKAMTELLRKEKEENGNS